ncbi:MAG TPA: ribonucleoside-diphosphate reductase subunit alpha [Patescibacteria group bacterium]|jgi:ribonucleoside-diphosphate reductase alpha chain|nr:ribonucleoside-diphosphate reductase subunit alpha [Patescibacteria group bacterium]
MEIKKRSGEIVPFDLAKIKIAISKAYVDVHYKVDESITDPIAEAVFAEIEAAFSERIPGVEDVQNIVERKLMESNLFDVAKCYIIYRYEHTKVREEKKAEVLEKIDKAEVMVQKRNGTTEPFSLQKVQTSLEKILSSQPDEIAKSINVPMVINQLRLEIYENITTQEIERALIMVLRSFIEKDPGYSQVAARALANKLYKEVIGADKIDFNKLEEQLREAFIRCIGTGVSARRLDPRMLTFNLEYIASELANERDSLLSYLATQTLNDRYFTRVPETKELLETPQMFWMRVAMGLALEEQNKEAKAVEFYRIISTLHFVPSSPTLFNSGMIHSQLSSCYLTTIEDDLDNIFKSYGDNAQLSKWSGGLGNDWSKLRGTGALIKKNGIESQGVIPFLKIANDVTVAISRSGRKRGATCAYLETWHWDIEDFLELRKNTGDDRRRTHDMNTSNWVPDLFMQRVKADGMWSLFSPDETPELHELYGSEFKRTYERYELKGLAGELNLFKQVKAKDLWKRMLTMLFETGHPWVTFKDPSNIRSPQDHVGVVHSSNLCTEITLNTSKDEIAVCNLGSVNLAKHIRQGQLDIEKMQYTVTVAMRMLDNVIDLNFYPTVEAKNSNMKHRPVGLGIMGFHDALYQQGINFDSEAMVEFADASMEAVSYYAIYASSQLAKERGAYASYRGSKWDRNIFPVDTIALLEQERGEQIPVSRTGKLDWAPVRASVAEFGMRNSNTMAIAPTATISNISGAIPSIEPIYKNIYVKANISGDFVVINQYLVEDLKKIGMWNEEMISQLKFNDGRLSDIPNVPQELKDKYKEVFEIDPKWLIRAAAYRGKWIDQSQSLNVFYGGKSGKDINDIYIYAWDMGIKTTYYLRTMAASQVEKSTVDTAAFGNTHIRGESTGSNALGQELGLDTPQEVPAAQPVPVTPIAAAVAPMEAVAPASSASVYSNSPMNNPAPVSPFATAPDPVKAVAENPVQEREIGTFKVEPTPLSAMTSGFAADGAGAGSVASLSASDLKLCRIDNPDCEACQ